MARAGTAGARKAARARSAPAVPTLREIQDIFQNAILAGDDAVLGQICDNSRTGRETLLGVYRDAYVGRLVDVLQNDHGLLLAYLGDEQFRVMAEAFIKIHTSHAQNARWFSQQLPEFLEAAPPYSGYRHVAELAAIERALNLAFDAADAPVLAISDLAAIAPAQWGEMVLGPHPASLRLDLETNALDLWMALKNEGEVPEPEDAGARTHVIVWRHDVTPMIRSMGAEEAMMWDEAAKGVRFGVLCELVATYDDAETAALRAAQYLQGWIVSGMLSSARVAR